jgi:hypothetical protein
MDAPRGNARPAPHSFNALGDGGFLCTIAVQYVADRALENRGKTRLLMSRDRIQGKGVVRWAHATAKATFRG